MTITIIGASAGLGFETLKRALNRNHKVITLSRSKIDIERSENLTSIIGNATNIDDLQKVIINTDAIIVTLGTKKDMKKTSLFSDFANTLALIHKNNPIEIPIIVVTGFGAGESKNYVSLFVKLFLKFFLKDVYYDKSMMEEIIEKTFKKWIIVRPGQLLDGSLTEQYRVETSLYKGINIGAINRADVADFLVKQAESPTCLNMFAAISSR